MLEVRYLKQVLFMSEKEKTSNMEFSAKNMNEAFSELMKEDYTEIAQRIMESMQEKKSSKKGHLFGYDFVNGVPTINEEESKIVKWIYERYLSYSENPTIALIEFALKRSEEHDEIPEDISYEEAKHLVNDDLVKKYIAEELSLKVLYHQVILERLAAAVKIEDILSLPLEDIPRKELTSLMTDISKKTHENFKCINRVITEEFYSGVIKFRKGNEEVKRHHESITIISPEMFIAAQEVIKFRQKKQED